MNVFESIWDAQFEVQRELLHDAPQLPEHAVSSYCSSEPCRLSGIDDCFDKEGGWATASTQLWGQEETADNHLILGVPDTRFSHSM